jgi:hypothetical protein
MKANEIYRAMVDIDGVRSYIYVRADNMSQAFDCALMRTKAMSPQSYVEVITAQELSEPLDAYIRPVEVSLTPIERSARRLLNQRHYPVI